MAYGAKTYTLREESTESAQSILSALRTGRGDTTNWKYQNSYSLNFGRWSAGTETCSSGTSGTGSLTRYGTKRFTDVR